MAETNKDPNGIKRSIWNPNGGRRPESELLSSLKKNRSRLEKYFNKNYEHLKKEGKNDKTIVSEINRIKRGIENIKEELIATGADYEISTIDEESIESAMKRLKAEDSSCFIATQIYGIDAVETNQFRAFRNMYLLNNYIGNQFVRTYYALSPKFIPYLKKSPTLSRITKYVLDKIYHSIK